MSTVNIELSQKAMAAAKSRASQGCCSLDSYLESLIIADASEDFGAPEHLRVTSQPQLVRILREGESSPTSEMTSADWSVIRQQLITQHSNSKIV